VSGKPVLPRELAHRDVEAAADYYVREAGPDIALNFIKALQSAYRAIAEHPAHASPRYAQELALPELRSLAVNGFPYLVFYVERDDQIDIW
jgi:toxin ParE1/3/4